VARAVIPQRSIDYGPPCCTASARDVGRTIVQWWPIASTVTETLAITSISTVDDSVAVVRGGSLNRPLDRIRHERVVVRGGPIRRPLDRSLDRIRHQRVIALRF
jgi:hypothetical protein